MEKKIKVAGYVRVSTAIQVEEGESLTTQKQQIADYVKSKENWELINIYSDEGLSGSKIEYRTNFQQMIKDAKQGQFSIIVFTKFSRFARNARDFHNQSYELNKCGVSLASTKENIDPTTHTGKMMIGLLALFAEWEHETIREQMYENKMIRWRGKKTFLGITPFGYTWNKAKMILEVNDKEKEIYHRIVNMYMSQNMAFRDIAVKLNAEGLITTRIKKDGSERKRANWYSSTISYLLKNPCYYGHYVVNKVVYEDGKNGAGTSRSKKLKPESENITFPIEALINKAEWDRIQARTKFKKVQTKHTGEHTNKFFLRDVVVCNRCGSKMNKRFGSKRKDDSINRYYSCYWSSTSKKNLEGHREHKCTLPNIKAAEIENRVWADIIMKFSFNPKRVFQDIFDPKEYELEDANLLKTIFNHKADLKAKNIYRNNLFKLLDKENCDIDEVNIKLQKNKDEILTIESYITEADDNLKKLRLKIEEQKKTLEFFARNKKQFSFLSTEIKNLCLADRKVFVEAMLDGPIRIDFQVDNEIDGPGGVDAEYKLHYNSEIIKRFIEEGKIKQLNTNSTDYYSPPYTRGGP